MRKQVLLQEPSIGQDFGFINIVDSLEHEYYKWKLQNLIYGEDQIDYRTDPFILAEDGVVYYPPELYEMPE